jgi:hypothetical protein
MKIQWRDNIEKSLDLVEHERINEVMKLLDLKDAIVIDSYSMSPNGPILSSLYLLSGPYLCEVRMTGKHLVFDISPAHLLANYRVTFGEHVSPIETMVMSEPADDSAQAREVQITTTKLVTVDLRHTDGLATQISYFGDTPHEWLEYVLKTYSISNLQMSQ